MRPIFFCTQLFGLAVWTCVPSIHNDFEKEKMVSVPTICNFLFSPSLPRTAASCAERIYGSTEIQLSNVNCAPLISSRFSVAAGIFACRIRRHLADRAIKPNPRHDRASKSVTTRLKRVLEPFRGEDGCFN
jgi:hypothetical protein